MTNNLHPRFANNENGRNGERLRPRRRSPDVTSFSSSSILPILAEPTRTWHNRGNITPSSPQQEQAQRVNVGNDDEDARHVNNMDKDCRLLREAGHRSRVQRFNNNKIPRSLFIPDFTIEDSSTVSSSLSSLSFLDENFPSLKGLRRDSSGDTSAGAPVLHARLPKMRVRPRSSQDDDDQDDTTRTDSLPILSSRMKRRRLDADWKEEVLSHFFCRTKIFGAFVKIHRAIHPSTYTYRSKQTRDKRSKLLFPPLKVSRTWTSTVFDHIHTY